MNLFLKLSFLFFLGSVSGWVIELFFRRFVSAANAERKWINPGFCSGPYLPLYGFGLCVMYLIAGFEKVGFVSSLSEHRLILFLIMAVCMTAIEYIAGIFTLKVLKVRLWDYTNERFNVQGIICPKFSLAWAALGAIYYFLIHPHILEAIDWLAQNLAYCFVVGMFFGIFILDVARSIDLTTKLKKYAVENNAIVKYEALKTDIRAHYEMTKLRYHFFRPFHSERPLSEHLKDILNSSSEHKRNKR